MSTGALRQTTQQIPSKPAPEDRSHEEEGSFAEEEANEHEVLEKALEEPEEIDEEFDVLVGDQQEPQIAEQEDVRVFLSLLLPEINHQEKHK